jgi:hypothetical protein
MFFAEINHSGVVVEEFRVRVQTIPVNPADFIILAVGIIVAVLRVSHFITGENHGNALADQQYAGCIFDLFETQALDAGIIGLSFRTAIPAVVVVVTVTVEVTVGLIVLVIVRHQIHQGKSVMSGDKIDRSVQASAVPLVKIGRSDNAPSDSFGIDFAFQEAPDIIAILSVPFRPSIPCRIAARSNRKPSM